MGRPAVFLDRDGTLTREADYLRSVAGLRLLPGATEAVRRLRAAGFAVVLITNQSGIARGLYTEADLDLIHRELQRRLARRGTTLDAIYYCPHHPEVGKPPYRRRCPCRKPAPGMLTRAIRDLDLDAVRSFCVGDSARDVAAGQRVGARTVLVRTGYGRRTEAEAEAKPDHVARDLPEAVTWILAQRRRRA